MRLVRLGDETSLVGADVRAALASWGQADTVLGGVALLGVTPLGCPRPVEAVLLLPRGVLVVVGIDLPDPAVRLDAPLHDRWLADGWPLVRPDGAVNPAGEALAAAAAVATRLHAGGSEPVPVATVVAVGPYVGQVVQPTVDLNNGVRVLHPTPRPMLSAVRELAVAERPCSVDQARRLLAVLVGAEATLPIGELAAEGFADSVTPDLATASTTLLPRIVDRHQPARARRTRAPRPRRSTQLRWLPMGALGLLAALLIAGIAVALVTTGGTDAPPAPMAGASTGPTDVTIGGVRFSPKGSTEGTDCAAHSYGDVQAWLTDHPCATVTRSVYQTGSGGQVAAVAIAAVRFPAEVDAKSFGAVAGTPGSGGITDLVRDGEGWAGGPKSFDGAAYTVDVRGNTVRLTEVAWIGRPSDPADPGLKQLAATSAGLPANS